MSKRIKSTKPEIQEALNYQRQESNWNFYSERELLENSVNQRVNFVIAVFALFMTAAATVNGPEKLLFIFGSGAVLMLILTLTTYRVYVRLDVILQILYKADDKAVLPIMNLEMKRRFSFWPMVFWIYVVVPCLCTAILILGFISAWNGWLTPTNPACSN